MTFPGNRSSWHHHPPLRDHPALARQSLLDTIAIGRLVIEDDEHGHLIAANIPIPQVLKEGLMAIKDKGRLLIAQFLQGVNGVLRKGFARIRVIGATAIDLNQASRFASILSKNGLDLIVKVLLAAGR